MFMKLTDSQIYEIKNHYKPFQEINLTKDQQIYIVNNAQIKEPPTKIIVVRPEDAKDNCTCGLSNIGLIINWNTVEIPKEYIFSDKEAKARQIE